jgi:hypothetical protein
MSNASTTNATAANTAGTTSTNAFTAPMASAFQTGFETMVASMNGMIDANARFMNECNAMVIDAVRTQARAFERVGTIMVEQSKTPAAKPATEATREIFDESAAFVTKTSERMMKLHNEHMQSMSKIMNSAMTRMQPVANASCCKA